MMSAHDADFDSSIDDIDDISDEGSDFEVELKAMKRKKAASIPRILPLKRQRRKAPLPHMSSSGSTPPGRSPRPQPSLGTPRQPTSRPAGISHVTNLGISAGELYEAIRSGKSATVTVVDEWLDGYKQSREAGLLVLINFIIQCCGCKGVVTREMFDSMQNAEIISALTKDFNEDSVSYPLCSPGPQCKRFRTSLFEFVRVLVRSCQNSLLYDEYLFSSLLALLTGLSDSQVRAFRHTSTLLAMKLMTGVVEVSMRVCTQLQTSERRYEIESGKDDQDRAISRLEELQASIKELHEHREELSFLITGTFRGVFVHRYRDQVPEIRAACIEELGVWLRDDPERFLNDGYLKYLGWTLADKQASVRVQCVRALQGLYKEQDFIGRLELFTSRFKERMLSMVLDKEPYVAVEVVNLLGLIHERTEEGLAEDESCHIYPLVFAVHRGLASAAGGFLYNKLKSLMKSEPGEHGKTVFFTLLISFYTQSEFHEHGAYLVDSLWEVAGSELRDWETMTSLLLQDNYDGHGKGLTYEEEGALIELMMCAMRQAAEITPPVGRAQGKRDKKTQVQDKRRITTHYIPLLPQLLAKYSADVEKASALLKAPLYFVLETYSSAGRLEKYLDLLLAQVCSVVEKHTDCNVLEACARLACALASDSHTFSSRARLAFSRLLDGLADVFNARYSEVLQGTADEDDLYSAAMTLKRISAFSSAMDLTGWKLFEPCLQLLETGMESRDIDKELMVPALKCAAFHVLWAKVTANSSRPTEVNLRHLEKEVSLFCNVCEKCLSLGQAEVRDQAFELLCDVLVIYSVPLAGSEPSLPSLLHSPSDSLRSEMAAYLMDFIFAKPDDNGEDEDDVEVEEVQITALQRKRNQLAGYCKLVIYGAIDLSAAADVFKHYSKCYTDFGDIIKNTIHKTKHICPVQSARTVCVSLQQLFSEMMISSGGSMQELGEIKDLAKKLAMSFGIDMNRVREPLLALHTDGMHFAFRQPDDGHSQPVNLMFLEVLSEFSFKLLRQDCQQLSLLLKSKCPSGALSCTSVRVYQRSLETRALSKHQEASEGDRGRQMSLHSPPVAKRRRSTNQGLVSSTSTEPWLDRSSSIHSNLPIPVLTSTVQRQQGELLVATPTAARDSDQGSGRSEPDSEEDFSNSMQMRKVRPRKRRPVGRASDPLDLDTHLTLLSLIEEDNVEDVEEEPDIEAYDSDHDTGYTLPSTRNTSTSFLEELFE